MEKFNSYNQYKKTIWEKLPVVAGKDWNDGVWKNKGEEINRAHILPLEKKNTPTNRAAAISKHVGFDCKKCLGNQLIGLHQFAHHLTSSQLLCMMFFSKLIDDELQATEKLVTFMKKAFGIEIHEGAQCKFEYTEEKDPSYMFDVKDGELKKGQGFYEGTSFDFHIQDGDVEVYFEIKFTEQEGFKKEKIDGRHELKAKQYLEIAPKFVTDNVSIDGFLNQYQIYRNMIRAKSDNKHVIFISDGNNPATNKDKEMLEKLGLPENVQFTTWQEICKEYPDELPLQLKAMLSCK